MCTVTWIVLPELGAGAGYELFFNRDERRTRRPALPPTAAERDNVRYLAPTDADAGGTWLCVNELGLTLGLLNGYELRDGERSDVRSRGELVRELAGCPALDDVATRLAARDLTCFRSFQLLALEACGRPRVFHWDGERLDVDAAPEAPLVSSSFDPTRAGEARRALYRELGLHEGLDAQRLAAYHASHRPQRGPFSVCMHRDDASTVSSSRVRVDCDEVSVTYDGGPPCQGRPALFSSLRRAGATSRT